MKILVLGANGNLGHQIVSCFSHVGLWQIIPWTSSDYNLCDYAAFEKRVADILPDYIINTVAYNNVDACEYDKKEQGKAIMLNIELPSFLSFICLSHKIKLIHFSSNYVFSGREKLYYEDSQTNPINFYGITKEAGERLLNGFVKLGLAATIIRISNLFGPKGNSQYSKPSFFDIIEHQASISSKIYLVEDEISCFCYSKDVAAKLRDLILSERTGGVYHFANENPLSWYDAGLYYIGKKGLSAECIPVSSSFFSRQAKRPQTAILTSTRTTKMRRITEAIDEFINQQ